MIKNILNRQQTDSHLQQDINSCW